MRSHLLKRILDILGSLALLVLFSPVILIVGILVWLKLGRPVFFRQVRPGYKGKTFTLYKFRTMLEATDSQGRPLSDNQRLTRFGRWLRSTSLDELPELWNVLRGNMSLVGPRPLLIEHLPLYTDEQSRRHDVLSGLTGWAQINGRDSLAWDEKLKLDVWYVDHWSNWLDLVILYRTAWAVFRRDGVVHPEAATMEQFLRSRGGVESGRSPLQSEKNP